MTNGYTLYTTIDRDFFFLVPDDITLLPGDFDIITLTGRRERVDVHTLEQFEISREAAEVYLEERLSNVITKAADGLKNLLNGWRAKKETTPQSQPRFTMDVLANLMDEDVESLKTDPEARKRGWKMLLSHVALVFGGALSENAADLEVARTRMREIVAVLNYHGIPVAEELQSLPQKLREIYDAAHEEKK